MPLTIDGVWVTERIVKTKWQPAHVEKTFRSLKGEIRLRPNHAASADMPFSEGHAASQWWSAHSWNPLFIGTQR